LSKSTSYSDATQVVHAGSVVDEKTAALSPVIVTSTTFEQTSPGVHKGYEYSRAATPTRDQLETALARLENTQYALSFASGLAAEQAILQLCDQGDHILSCDDVYGGTRRLGEKVWARYGLTFNYMDTCHLDKVETYLKQHTTKMLWIETPTNPTLRIMDLQSLGALAKKYGCLFVVDNTFASPIFQKPIDFGADIIVHSTTKYISGHCDVLGGAVMTSQTPIYEKLQFLQMATGAVPSPFDCYLLLRSLPTLALRMHKHAENALKLATFLSNHNKITKVIYPGLPSHPNHELAKQQMSGCSGMVSFYYDTDLEGIARFSQSCKLFYLAESLGGVKSMINHPAAMTHVSVDKTVRESLGITDQLLRLSVGIEDPEDLIADLKQALK